MITIYIYNILLNWIYFMLTQKGEQKYLGLFVYLTEKPRTCEETFT